MRNLKQQEKIILNQLKDAEDQPEKLKELSQAIRSIRQKENSPPSRNLETASNITQIMPTPISAKKAPAKAKSSTPPRAKLPQKQKQK